MQFSEEETGPTKKERWEARNLSQAGPRPVALQNPCREPTGTLSGPQSDRSTQAGDKRDSNLQRQVLRWPPRTVGSAGCCWGDEKGGLTLSRAQKRWWRPWAQSPERTMAAMARTS